MPTRHFTVKDANDLLPVLRPLMAELLDHRAQIVQRRDAVAGILEDSISNVGSPDASRLVLEFMAIERLLQQIRALGVEVKDVNVGLLDFPATIDGREVYLCWRFGEERVAYYHDLHTGYAGRRRLD